MSKTILEYQEAFEKTVEKLKNKDNILGILVFGSIVNGDLWENSDIDLIVIEDNNFNKDIINIYTEENDVPVHIRLIGKLKFISLCKGDNKGAHMHRLFCSSKLVFSKDKCIDDLYDEERYYNEYYGSKWNIVYLSELLKSMSECRKYLQIESIYNAYTIANITFRNYAKLLVNSRGYMINRDVINMALNLDNDFHNIGKDFFEHKGELKESIEKLLNYIDLNININLKNYATILIDYMKELNVSLSSSEIANSDLFIDYNINMQVVLEKLCANGIVKKTRRPYRVNDKSILIDENVYYI